MILSSNSGTPEKAPLIVCKQRNGQNWLPNFCRREEPGYEANIPRVNVHRIARCGGTIEDPQSHGKNTDICWGAHQERYPIKFAVRNFNRFIFSNTIKVSRRKTFLHCKTLPSYDNCTERLGALRLLFSIESREVEHELPTASDLRRRRPKQ